MKKILVILFILFAISACRNQQAEHDTHDHDHDEVKLFIIAYNESFEVFAEADPFVQGKTSEILAHFTHLENFKPFSEGTVTVSLVSSSNGIRHTLDAPNKPGIYRFRLQPQTTGMARVQFDLEYKGVKYRLDGGSYPVFDNEHDAIHAAEDLIQEHPAAIAFTKEQSWLVSFATAPVEHKAIGVVVKTVGEVMPAQGDEITLSAQSRGIIRFVNNNLYEGVDLQRGEVLINISGEGLAEGSPTQQYREARNNFEKAKADYERLSPLAEANIVSQRDLLQAKNEFDNAKAIFDNLSENFSESGQSIKSPVDGYLAQLFVQHGQYVEAGQPIAKVVRNYDIIIRAEVQQRYSRLLPELATVNISSRDGEIYTLEELNGKILSWAKNTTAHSHLLPVYLEISNLPGWHTGTLLDVFLKTSDTNTSLVVPTTALIEEQGNYFVFVQIHPESFEKREVFIGKTDGMFTEILRGLSDNERVVSRGALMVKMAAVSGNIDPHSGHVH
ncbi:MAG: efflux RND transporter periplasmic adaptor subunit [Bacteroidales bacterium]|nr:efflux RND transporter periplasmic adaptor subunit [Bacteroidales bacterium]